MRGLGARPERSLRGPRVLVVRVAPRKASALISRLARIPAVKHVERDRVVMRITASEVVEDTPSDPLWALQWGAALIKAPTAWAVTKGSPNVVVAVLDTGVDLSQPDLQGAFVPGYDFVNNDADPSDDLGHGTAVAGIVAARSGNGLGGAGFCPRCSVMPLKVAGADGSASEANVASGITWATEHGARVINLSLGGSYGATVGGAVAYATSKGALVVAAAGNNGNSNAFYPAADPGALSVAATQPNDQLYSWSNYGGWVAVAAPGCDLTTHPGGLYAEFCGTSASTPVVSGLAALGISYAPTASGDEIKQAITSSAYGVGGVTYGRVDFAGTLAALGATFQAAPAPVTASAAPSVPVASSAPGGSVGVSYALSRRLAVKALRGKRQRGSRASRQLRFLRLAIVSRRH
jgi:subtilisin family serine protease